jgi:hypothetical protein
MLLFLPGLPYDESLDPDARRHAMHKNSMKLIRDPAIRSSHSLQLLNPSELWGVGGMRRRKMLVDQLHTPANSSNMLATIWSIGQSLNDIFPPCYAPNDR